MLEPLIMTNRSISRYAPILCAAKDDDAEMPTSSCDSDDKHRGEGTGMIEGAVAELAGIAVGALIGGPFGAFAGGIDALGLIAAYGSNLRGDLWFYEKVPSDTLN